MKNSIKYIMIVGVALLLGGCAKRNFFEDVDDPFLSRFTSHRFNIATAYFNGESYINPFGGVVRGNYPATLTKISGSTNDTLNLSWPIEKTDTSSPYPSEYKQVSIFIPVPASFKGNELPELNGKSFTSNTSKVWVEAEGAGFPPHLLEGTANIYFVRVRSDSSNGGQRIHYNISGLFNANIGDSIMITKGRFDFNISTVEF